MPLYRDAPLFAKPMPANMTSPEAHLARDQMSEWVADRRRERETVSVPIVTHHLQAWYRIELDELTGAAATFARKAVAAGRTVAARQAGDCVCVGVRCIIPVDDEPGVELYGIRAYWTKGRSTGVTMGGRKVPVAKAVASL